MWKEKWWGRATWKNGSAFLWLGELLLRKKRRWGGAWAVMSVHGEEGDQRGRLQLKRPHPCFSRCPSCNLSLFFLKRQQIPSFRKRSDNKREKSDLCWAFVNCFTATIASGSSFYNAFSITVSPTCSLPLLLFPITLLHCLMLYNVSNPLLGLLAKFRLLLNYFCLKWFQIVCI